MWLFYYVLFILYCLNVLRIVDAQSGTRALVTTGAMGMGEQPDDASAEVPMRQVYALEYLPDNKLKKYQLLKAHMPKFKPARIKPIHDQKHPSKIKPHPHIRTKHPHIRTKHPHKPTGKTRPLKPTGKTRPPKPTGKTRPPKPTGKTRPPKPTGKTRPPKPTESESKRRSHKTSPSPNDLYQDDIDLVEPTTKKHDWKKKVEKVAEFIKPEWDKFDLVSISGNIVTLAYMFTSPRYNIYNNNKNNINFPNGQNDYSGGQNYNQGGQNNNPGNQNDYVGGENDYEGANSSPKGRSNVPTESSIDYNTDPDVDNEYDTENQSYEITTEEYEYTKSYE